MNDYWKVLVTVTFVGVVVLVGMYLGACALFVISGY